MEQTEKAQIQTTPRPTRGRVLQYVMTDPHPFAGQVFPAIVTRVYSHDTVQLCVFTPGPHSVDSVKITEDPERGAAYWPDFAADAQEVYFVAPLSEPEEVKEPEINDPGEPAEPQDIEPSEQADPNPDNIVSDDDADEGNAQLSPV